MSSDDDLTRAMRGGGSGEQSPADARLADALRALRAHGQSTQPRANATLAGFLSHACSPTAADQPHAEPRPRRDLVTSSIRRPLRKLAGLGLVAKVVLGASLALGGATAVAATTGAPEGNDSVVVTPVSSDSSLPAQISDDSDDGTADQGHGDARRSAPATSPATVTSPAAVQHRRHDDGADRSGQSGRDQVSADESDDSGRHDGSNDGAGSSDSHDGSGHDDGGHDGSGHDGTADQGGSNPDD
ncbi:MAG: hypothetical protein ACXV2J_11050 [Actinomycetes bacterium]